MSTTKENICANMGIWSIGGSVRATAKQRLVQCDAAGIVRRLVEGGSGLQSIQIETDFEKGVLMLCWQRPGKPVGAVSGEGQRSIKRANAESRNGLSEGIGG